MKIFSLLSSAHGSKVTRIFIAGGGKGLGSRLPYPSPLNRPVARKAKNVNWRAGASLPSRPTGAIFLSIIIGERERAYLVVQLARFFGIYIYIYIYIDIYPALMYAVMFYLASGS